MGEKDTWKVCSFSFTRSQGQQSERNSARRLTCAGLHLSALCLTFWERDTLFLSSLNTPFRVLFHHSTHACAQRYLVIIDNDKRSHFGWL